MMMALGRSWSRRCLSRIVLASPFQLRSEIKRRFAVFAGLAIAQMHEVGEQIRDGVVPVTAGDNLEVANGCLGGLPTVIVLAFGFGW
jgi:hypothetical protein